MTVSKVQRSECEVQGRAFSLWPCQSTAFRQTSWTNLDPQFPNQELPESACKNLRRVQMQHDAAARKFVFQASGSCDRLWGRLSRM